MGAQHQDILAGWTVRRTFDFEFLQRPHAEAGKNTSTVIPASRKGRRKGNPVVSDERVMYGYASSVTLTTHKLHYKLQTRPLVRSGKFKNPMTSYEIEPETSWLIAQFLN
jgi:hypothetical protein